jgi:putative DNA primase/helicase
MFRRRYRPASVAAAWPTAREIAARLKGETRPDTSGNYACRCPGPLHRNGDINPSLSVKDGKNGRPLLHCHAGCDFRDVVAALERMGILPRRER